MPLKVYKSSAGSGKTFTLTKEFLKLALSAPGLSKFDPSYYRNILAVTFTNMAVKEMKERIRKYLSEIGKAGSVAESFMAKLILDELAAEQPNRPLNFADLKIRAQQVQSHLLHHYTDFSVSTIDAFNQKIVKSFSRELGFPYNFEVMLDQDELLDEATDLLLAEASKGSDLGKLFSSFAQNKALKGDSWYLETDIRKVGQQLFKEEVKDLARDLPDISMEDVFRIRKKLDEYTGHVDELLQQYAQQAYRLITDSGLEVGDFYRGSTGVGGYIEKLANGSKTFLGATPNSYVHTTLDDHKWVGSKSANKKSIIEQIVPALTTQLVAIIAMLEKERSNYILAEKLQKSLLTVAVLKVFQKQLDNVQLSHNYFHLSETNSRINEVVEKEPVPYLYERIGERYRHILIDEFQDTSRKQWHNMLPLVLNTLGTDSFNLLVGDAKQAIYRWRDGKAEMLAKLPQMPSLVPGSMLAEEVLASGLADKIDIANLATNYRSYEHIIDFNNEFFAYLTRHFAGDYPESTSIYKEATQEKHRKQMGYVRFDHIETSLEESGKAANTAQLDTVYLATVTERIGQLLKQGWNYKDIAILVRANKDGYYLAKGLLAADIPVVSSESLKPSYSPEVRFMLDFFQLIDTPQDAFVRLRILVFIEQHLLTNGAQPEGGFFKLVQPIVQADAPLEDMLQWLKERYDTLVDIRKLAHLTLYEMAEKLIRIFQLDKNVVMQIFVHRFLQFALDFTAKKGNNLQDFLAYYEQKKSGLSVSAPENSNAVKIFTIHKAKGLQFPVVILPFCDWQFTLDTKSSHWFSLRSQPMYEPLSAAPLSYKDLDQTIFADAFHAEKEAQFADAINMLYVALTRPEMELHIMFAEGKKKSKTDVKNVGQLLQSFLQPHIKIEEEKEILAIDSEPEGSGLMLLHSTYERGEPVVKKAGDSMGTIENIAESKQESGKKDLGFYHTANHNMIRMRRDELLTADDAITGEGLFSAQRRGLLIHYVFEHIRYATDMDTALQKLLSQGYARYAELPEIASAVKKVLENKELATYYQPQPGQRIKLESEIMLPTVEGSQQVYRPDRLVLREDEACIIDYKTGAKKATHQQQIDRYGQIISQIGFSKIKKILVYTNDGQVVISE